MGYNAENLREDIHSPVSRALLASIIHAYYLSGDRAPQLFEIGLEIWACIRSRNNYTQTFLSLFMDSKVIFAFINIS